MALFGSTSSVIGLDIGTSSLKVVELIRRRRTLEVATYAQAAITNLLTRVVGDDADEIQTVANVITRLLDQAGVSTDRVVAALPSSVVFSTVLRLPDIPEADMEKAVQFAARDVVPANLDEMVLGWSRVGHTEQVAVSPDAALPVFITAAPKELVARYTRMMELLHLELVALEVETLPLVRSLLGSPSDSALIVDIGARVTTFHLIDAGTARVSQTIEYGGEAITETIAAALSISPTEAEELKVSHGMGSAASAELIGVLQQAMEKIISQARQLCTLYQRREGQKITKAVLIGGGSNLIGLAPYWTKNLDHTTTIGNPWRDLSYPKSLDGRLQEMGPTYAVAVGLAQRGFTGV